MHSCDLTFQRDFSIALAWTRDAGITTKIWQDAFNLEAKLREEASPRPKLHVDNRLKVNHMIPSFIVFGIGIAASVVAFGLDWLLTKCKPARARRRHASRPPRSHIDAIQRRKAWEAQRHDLKSVKQAPDGSKFVEVAPESAPLEEEEKMRQATSPTEGKVGVT